MGSHQAKKSPAKSPHGNISIPKRAVNSPVQHHSLLQIYLMPLQLWFSCLSALAATTPAPFLLHHGSSAELAPSLLEPQECFNTSQKQFPLGNPWEPQDMTCCCHPRHHTAGTSFPLCHPLAHFFTRNDFQVSASPSSPATFCFHTAPLVIYPQSPFLSLQASCCPHHLCREKNTTTSLPKPAFSWHLHPRLSPGEAGSAAGEAG